MKHKLRGLYLGELDIQLLQYLHAVKVATYEQIARDVYVNHSLASVGNRLRKLENNRLIVVEQSRLLLGGKRLVGVSKEAFENFVQRGGEMVVELKTDAPMHDLVLVDIRHAFLKSPKTVSYLTENEIQAWQVERRKLNCDALVTVDLGNGSFEIPIEYEASMKKAERYEPLVKKYYETQDLPFVAFVGDSQAILEKVKQVEKQLYNWDRPKFFYQLATEFLSSDALRLENCHGASLNLGCEVSDGLAVGT